MINSRRRALITAGGGNPILSISNLEAWWDRDGIQAGATTQGANVNTWTDVIGARVLNATVGQPTLNLNGGLREVRFNGASMMAIDEWAAIDFTPRTDTFTLVVKIGQTLTGAGTLIGKQQDGSNSIQYQMTAHDTINNYTAHHVGTINTVPATSYWARATTPQAITTGNAVFMLTVGTGTTSTAFYYNNTLLSYNFYGNESNLTVGTQVNDFRVTVGGRRGGSDTVTGFALTGDIAHVLIFSKELSTAERNTVHANLN